MRWSWFIFVILPWVSDGYRILCLLPYAGKSHHMVFEPLLAQLAARGHQLTVVSFFPAAPPQPRRRDVSLAALAPLSVEVVDLNSLDYHWFGLERYFETAPTVIGLARANLEFCEKLLDADIFQEFVQTKGDYDLILTEHFNSDCMLGIIHKYGVPSIGLQSSAMLPWTYSRVGAPDNPSYVPVMTLGLTDDMTFGERIINAIYLYSCLIWIEIEIRWKEQRLLESKLGKLPPLGDIARNASLLISNTHHSLSGNRVVPPVVLEAGGIHLHNRSAQPLPRELEQWVSEWAHGFILFSFGSLVRGASLPAARLAAIAAALARLPQRVLWKWEAAATAAAAAAFPDNVRTVRWLPQYDLLNHPNCVAFITHGGLLSLTEAVSAGVPMMMVPILGDQFGNAAHAKKAGIAEVLRLQDITEESLHTALLKILSPAARARAKRMRDIWMDRPQPPMDSAVFHIERVVRHKLTNLSSEARWLNTLQLLLLDVLAFFVVLIGLPVYLIVKLISKKSRRKLKQS